VALSGAACVLPQTTPNLQQTSAPVVGGTYNAARTIKLEGSNFGATRGTVTLQSGNTTTNATINNWAGTEINITVPNSVSPGPWQLLIHASNGAVTPVGVTVHVLGSGYNPPVKNVDPPTSDPHALQKAINSASPGDLLVLAAGEYQENVVINKPLILQGRGSGGETAGAVLPALDRVLTGSAINGKYFVQNKAAWTAALNSASYSGDQTVSPGAGITVVAPSSGPRAFDSGLAPRIDGVAVRTSQSQGAGGIQVNAWAKNLQITNDTLEGNGGNFSGGIAIGKPYVGDNHNDDVLIRYDNIEGNGAKSKAGGIGLFNGAARYQVRNNTICANFSFEYGAGISHYGRSSRATIADNKIFYNDSFDSGAGVTISEEVPAALQNGTQPLGTGSGSVSFDRNVVSTNYSGDDGGGLFVQNALTDTINLRNNMVVDNGAAHLGGGISMINSSDVRIVNNTVAYNVTTDSSETRDGKPHGAGLATEVSNPAFTGHGTFSQPSALFNNIFSQNRAYTLDVSAAPPALVDAGLKDFEVFGTGGAVQPRHSILSVAYGPSLPDNVIGVDPLFADPFAPTLDVTGNAVNPGTAAVTLDRAALPQSLPGDYHLLAGSRALGTFTPATQDNPVLGVTSFNGVSAPTNDIDNQGRPIPARTLPDIGADER
jgi:hypothetical protein